ncbi:hypothetical protein LAZ67_2002192 [Cordylochernes scorpioides]|uniref:Phosphatidic acid phosphatase type 2/haloperoxidase domain-containing protein n=1 Tax=Cordylochernes scorpioides TaxID=51811 RepID=A0ABY6K251_9ARAC|nr:hypothetical protein LAZ67_2002192 [Cordylochernes scorpioides]
MIVEIDIRYDRPCGLVAVSAFGGQEKLLGVRKPGFHCGDPSIRWPYHGDTVSVPVLFASVLLGPLAVLGLCGELSGLVRRLADFLLGLVVSSYVMDYNCTWAGTQLRAPSDIYKSFPSGHATFFAYAFVVIAVSVHRGLHLSFNSNKLRSIPMI